MWLYFSIPKMPCQIKKRIGIECPGCGLQRSVELLLNGEFGASIAMYPALLPAILTFILFLWHLKAKKSFTLQIFIVALCLTVLTALVSYILKFF